MAWYALIQEQVEDGIEVDGSNLSGVSGQCLWEDTSCKTGADSIHQGAAQSSDDDDKENLRIHRHHSDHGQPHISCEGQFQSRDGTQTQASARFVKGKWN